MKKKKVTIEQQLDSSNIASLFTSSDGKHQLYRIGCDVYDGYELDKMSRAEWENRYEEYIKLAAQVKETRNFPWPNSSNVKYPLLSTAALQFASRAYQQLFPSASIVKCRVIGEDPEGAKRASADRVAKHMSYQLIEQMEDWEDDMDRLCLVLPICGNVFKKTYRGRTTNVSELVLPNELVVNYYAKSIEKAARKTHILYFYENEMEEKFRSGVWRRPWEKTPTPVIEPDSELQEETAGVRPPQDHDDNAPHKIFEQHTFIDLDQDGYKEPVIVTIHADTKEVLRIVPRYTPGAVAFADDGETVVAIEPEEYFTNFRFIPDPVSGVYGQGFGSLLGPLNQTANSLINNLVDTGTLSTLPAGFLGRGVRNPKGDTPFKPGEWRQVNVAGGDLQKNIFPLPVKEPSTVLFNLLGLMLESGTTLSSVSDLMSGKSPGQNQPYQTTSDLLEQGLQVFSSIFKRIHRSLKKEFEKMFELNKEYVSQPEYFQILDSDEEEIASVNGTDYNQPDMNISPASDPSIVTNVEKMKKADTLGAFMQMGTVNPQEATRRMLEAQGHEDINKLMEMPPPEPDPEIELRQAELQLKELEVTGGLQVEIFKAEMQGIRDKAAATLNYAKADSETEMVEIERLKAESTAMSQAFDARVKEVDTEIKALIEKYKADKGAEKKQQSTPS